ncbi:putative alanyl-tRNA synthetase [Candidatus Carsonella ruddii HT isolate Thao2000]|uniref:Putative alanyl-tRNA synthetase n=1 Tax=Candidatus Carsonella ruddii HT isolate Thao2000 TaxID=1202539 RepID=J3VQC3_CARRU|nr:alanine--tRNA ligase-related protein [Candidatus Carsonella ruddii]AFP84156.1 putative alanyl-tRNA synthetase [Candidatus Carsonella ruddii HT isolate Thao2000]
MFNFIKYYNIYNFLIIGTQNVISNNNSLLFNNSGFSSIKNFIIKNNNNIVSYQYCIRIKGIFNDLKINNDGIHNTSFIMLGIFKKNKNLYKIILISLNYLYYFEKIKKNKIFLTLNKNDFFNIIILLLCKINIKKIIFTNKNIWKINKNGFLGFCIEFYILKNKKLIEIWNFVDIKFIKLKNIVIKIKNNIIDSGLGYNRIKNIKKKNFRLNDICNTIYLIKNNINLNFTKNHYFILNKLIKIIIKIILLKKINIFKIFLFFFKKKKKFFFKNKILFFFNYIIKKEFFIINKIKNINIKKINIFSIKYINESYGVPFNYIYKIIKNIYK